MSELFDVTTTTPDSPSESASSAPVPSVEAAVRADPNLTTTEKDALLTVYRSYLDAHKQGSG
jgi:hypothetical protein